MDETKAQIKELEGRLASLEYRVQMMSRGEEYKDHIEPVALMRLSYHLLKQAGNDVMALPWPDKTKIRQVGQCFEGEEFLVSSLGIKRVLANPQRAGDWDGFVYPLFAWSEDAGLYFCSWGIDGDGRG